MLKDITHHFPNLTPLQIEQLEKLQPLYADWNSKINVVSRKDFEHFYTRHVLHSLAIAKTISFKPDSTVIDIGTGGGFPGIPLAILFPKVQFTLVDSIAKKMKVVEDVSIQLGLKNVSVITDRSENCAGEYDYLVSRAVTQLPKFVKQTKHLIKSELKDSGIYYLKGGDFLEEIKSIKMKYQITDISSFFSDDFFETKKVVYLKI